MTLERAALPEASGSSWLADVPLPLCFCPYGPVSLGLVPFHVDALFLLMPGHGTEAPGKTKDAS